MTRPLLELALDADALVRESRADDHDVFLQRVLLEAEISGDREAEGQVRAAISRRAAYYRQVGDLWAWMAEGTEVRDMARVRGAHAGIRTAAFQELGGKHETTNEE